MSVKKTLDKAIRTVDFSEREIAEIIFDTMYEAGRMKNLNKGAAQHISERELDDKVTPEKVLEIYRKYKSEYMDL